MALYQHEYELGNKETTDISSSWEHFYNPAQATAFAASASMLPPAVTCTHVMHALTDSSDSNAAWHDCPILTLACLYIYEVQPPEGRQYYKLGPTHTTP